MTNGNTPDHLITLGGGRGLAANEYGNPDGPPVVLLPSAPGSRVFDPDPAITASSGIRLIVTDRAGYGHSTPHTGVPNWAQVATDHFALLDALHLDDVRVVGWSNGGLGALAMAALHSEQISSIALVGTPAPDDEVDWIPEAFKGFLLSLREAPDAAVDTLAPSFQPMMDDPSNAVASIAQGADDEHILAQHRNALVAMLNEAFRPGTLGVASDIVATNVAPLGIGLEDVTVPTDLFYGEGDVIIPPTHGEYYSKAIKTSRLHLLPSTGHLAIISHWRQIVAQMPVG